jgi:hypothetical protein
MGDRSRPLSPGGKSGAGVRAYSPWTPAPALVRHHAHSGIAVITRGWSTLRASNTPAWTADLTSRAPALADSEAAIADHAVRAIEIGHAGWRAIFGIHAEPARRKAACATFVARTAEIFANPDREVAGRTDGALGIGLAGQRAGLDIYTEPAGRKAACAAFISRTAEISANAGPGVAVHANGAFDIGQTRGWAGFDIHAHPARRVMAADTTIEARTAKIFANPGCGAAGMAEGTVRIGSTGLWARFGHQAD